MSRIHEIALGAWGRRTARGLLTLALQSSVLAWVSVAVGEEESRAADVAGARELAIEGLKLADANQCAAAIDRLSRAEKLHHAPIVLGRLGECEVAVGRLVDGTENLRRMLREPPAANAPAAVTKARERAQSVLDAAKAKIATLTISVRAPTDGVTVTIDGQPVPSALFDRGRPTDPGTHVLEATAEGCLPTSRQVELGPGEKSEIVLTLVSDPRANAVRNVVHSDTRVPVAENGHHERRPASVTEPAVRPPPQRPSHLASYVLWSVGTAAGTVGGILGYLALKDANALKQQCPNNICPSSAEETLASTRREATASTILLAGGGAALAVGTVLYLVKGSSAEQVHPSATARLRPVFGASGIGVHGDF